MNLTDWIGFAGVSMLLLAFLLNLTGTISRDGLVYLLLNLFGAGLACAASAMLKYVPFIILEGAWSLVSGFALMKYLRK